MIIRTEIKGYKITDIKKCLSCSKEVRVRQDYAHSGKCRSCSKQGNPYETNWKNLFHDSRKIPVTISYAEYLEFTKIKECHYCETPIPWQPHRKEAKSQQAYFLDTKDNNGIYSKENCVVCCTRCNRMHSNKFSYEEFYKFSAILKQITKERLK